MSPLTVTAWPYTPDPRRADFSVRGWAWGMVPPWKFLLTSSDAPPPFEALDTGVVITAFDDIADKTRYFDTDFFYRYTKTGFPEVIPSPEPHTVSHFLEITNFLGISYFGNIFALWPDAIQKFTIPVISQGDPNPEFPNPVTFTPRKWDFEL